MNIDQLLSLWRCPDVQSYFYGASGDDVDADDDPSMIEGIRAEVAENLSVNNTEGGLVVTDKAGSMFAVKWDGSGWEPCELPTVS